MKVGINGLGRIGRLALRSAFGAADRQDDDPRSINRLDVVHLNEIKGGAAATAMMNSGCVGSGAKRRDDASQSRPPHAITSTSALASARNRIVFFIHVARKVEFKSMKK